MPAPLQLLTGRSLRRHRRHLRLGHAPSGGCRAAALLADGRAGHEDGADARAPRASLPSARRGPPPSRVTLDPHVWDAVCHLGRLARRRRASDRGAEVAARPARPSPASRTGRPGVRRGGGPRGRRAADDRAPAVVRSPGPSRRGEGTTAGTTEYQREERAVSTSACRRHRHARSSLEPRGVTGSTVRRAASAPEVRAGQVSEDPLVDGQAHRFGPPRARGTAHRTGAIQSTRPRAGRGGRARGTAFA